MRMIKFRGKRLDGEWVYGDLLLDRGFGGDVISDVVWIRKENNKSYQALPETVGQWTGLVDKNRVEAYEKDVVDVYFEDGEIERAILVWDEMLFRYRLKSSDGTLWGFDGGLRFKIIGNLIDSPDLMEVE